MCHTNNGSIRKVNFQIASVCFWVLQKKVTKERRIFKAVQGFFFFFEITALRANFIQINYRSYKTSWTTRGAMSPGMVSNQNCSSQPDLERLAKWWATWLPDLLTWLKELKWKSLANTKIPSSTRLCFWIMNLYLNLISNQLILNIISNLLLCNLSVMLTLQVLSVCGVWRVRDRVQIFRRELHIHIYLDYVSVEFLSYNIYIYIYCFKSNL